MSPNVSETESRSRASDQKVRRLGAYVAAVFFGGVFGLIVTLIIVRVTGPGLLPAITVGDLNAARDKWSGAAIENYDLEVTVRAQDVSTYSLQVRDGLVKQVLRDDKPLRSERTWGTWMVEGMFETIDRDLSAADAARKGTSVAPPLLLRGVFDEQFGLPTRYQRTEVHKFESNQEVSWEINSFLPIQP